MGASFDSIQVRTADPNAHGRVVDTIGQLVANDPTYEPADASCQADRSIIIGPEGPWTAIYDQAADFGSEPFNDVLFAVAEAVSDYAVGLTLRDSDTLFMQLVGGGRVRDNYTNRPPYFAVPSDRDAADADYLGSPEKWRHLLVDGATLAQLGQAFIVDDLFAEHGLRRISKCFGWSAEHVETSLRHLDPGPAHTCLYFRRTSQPTPDLPNIDGGNIFQTLATGPFDDIAGELAPAEDPGGRHASPQTVSATPQLRRPKHYAGPAGIPHLRTMDNPVNLLALISLDAERECVAQEAAEVFEAWHALTNSPGYRRIVVPALDKRCTTGRISGENIPDGTAWKKLRGQMLSAIKVSLSAEPTGSAATGARANNQQLTGFSLFEPRIWFQDTDDHPLIHVGLVDGIGQYDAANADRLEAKLTELVDRLVERANGIQAFVARWDWEPVFSPDPTPYEAACGIQGQCTGGRAWQTRFLRAVTDRMWLGPALRERVDDADLTAVAHLTDVGDAIRIERRDSASHDQIEEALSGVLADANAWEDANNRHS